MHSGDPVDGVEQHRPQGSQHHYQHAHVGADSHQLDGQRQHCHSWQVAHELQQWSHGRGNGGVQPEHDAQAHSERYGNAQADQYRVETGHHVLANEVEDPQLMEPQPNLGERRKEDRGAPGAGHPPQGNKQHRDDRRQEEPGDPLRHELTFRCDGCHARTLRSNQRNIESMAMPRTPHSAM